MAMLEPRLVLLHIIELVMMSILFGIGASWCWILWNLLKGRPLFPERPLVARGRTPWGSGTVLIVFVLYVAANLLLFKGYALVTRGSPSDEVPAATKAAPHVTVEKPDSPAPKQAALRSAETDQAEEPDLPPANPTSGIENKKDAKEFSLLELMSIQAVVNTFLLLLLPMVLRGTSGARLNDLGLSLDHWGRQVMIGLVAVLYLLPIIMGTQHLALKLLGPFDEQSRHPVERMLREQFSGGVAGLALVTAVILAPIFEELMFRGIFQSWLIELLERFRGNFGIRSVEPRGLDGDIYFADEPNPSPVDSGRLEEAESTERTACPPESEAVPDAMSREWSYEYWSAEDRVPALPASKASPPRLPSPVSAGAGIVLTSLIFAMLHAGQWPAPIPIFILAIGLGVIYYRTGSLLATICMHALFNATSTLALIWWLLMGQPGASEKKVVPPPAIERNAPLEKVNLRAQDVDRRPD